MTPLDRPGRPPGRRTRALRRGGRLVLAGVAAAAWTAVWGTAAGTARAEPRERFDPATLPLFTEGKPYMGKWQTGLYPGGKNQMPPKHLEAGLRVARLVRPRSTDGKLDEKGGRIVGLVMGHSNTTLYFKAFQQHLEAHADELNERFTLVVGSVAGQQLREILRPGGPVWQKSDKYIRRAGCSRQQVQVLFLHTTLNGPGRRSGRGPPPPPFPASMQRMQRGVATVLARCVRIYPNLRIAYLTSDGLRHYTGMEPHVWREAFAIKWLIESQIKGEEGTAFQDREGAPRALPWLCWGPYIWDNTWDRGCFTDGVHPTPKTRKIVVEKYWMHLKADPVARTWLFKPARKRPGSTTSSSRPTTRPPRRRLKPPAGPT